MMTSGDSAYLEVHQAFHIDSRQLFVVVGRIIGGSIRPGDVATFADRDNSFKAAVHGIESIRASEIPDAVALTFSYTDLGELFALQALPFRGSTLRFADHRRYPCPCCGNYTLEERPPGTDDICPVCFWEDDFVQFQKPGFAGGANHVSLNEARQNYAAIGVSDSKFQAHVRPPRVDELPSAAGDAQR